MSSIIGNYRFNIDAYLTDFRGKATLPQMSSFILQAATKHAEERGFGYSAMTALHKAWVLSRIVIEVSEYPRNDAPLQVRAAVRQQRGPGRGFLRRSHPLAAVFPHPAS